MSEVQTRPVGRPCKTCDHARRSEVEAELISGERTISAISTEFDLKIRALRRHKVQHMNWTEQQARDAGLAPVAIVAQLLDLSARLGEAMDDAEERRHPGDLARLALARERILRTLADRGVKPDLVQRNQELELDAGVLVTMVKAFPALAEEAAREYARAGYLSAAARVRTLISETKELRP